MSEFEVLVEKYPQFSFNDNPIKRDKNHSLLMIEPYSIFPNNYGQNILKQYKKCYTWNSKIYNMLKEDKDINIELLNGFPLFDNYSLLNDNEFIPIEQKIPGVALICRFRMGSQNKGDIINKRYEVFSGLQIEKACYGKIPYLISYYRGQIGEGPESFPSSRSKLIGLNHWKYNLCFENCYDSIFSWDYVTEKIYDSFLAKTIPIYLGCYNIQDHIPTEIFIDYRNFNNVNELSHYLRCLDEKKYKEMINNAYDWVMKNRYNKGSIKELIENVLEKE